jgi:hypothetical protein
MIRLRIFFVLGFFLAVVQIRCTFAATSRHFPAGGTLQFNLHDDINLPFYSWPRTLLSYPVDFSGDGVRPEQLSLFDASGIAQAMQLSEVRVGGDGTLEFARVNFFSDLPPGASRLFELRRSGPVASAEVVKETTHDGMIEVDAGMFQIRLPGDWKSGDVVPAPIIAVNRGTGWIGDNHLISPRRHVTNIQTQCIEGGDLFRTYRITYEFENGGVYRATIKIVLGYPFVDFREEMAGLASDDQAFVDMTWTAFAPTKRFPAQGFDVAVPQWMGIDEPIITADIEEDPKWLPPNVVEDPSREMAFRLAAFSGNGVRDAVPAASFWEDRAGGSELSLFTLDTLAWQDHQYGIWQPSMALQIHFRHEKGILHWTWPLVSGTRSTGIAFSDSHAAQSAADELVKQYLKLGDKFGGSGGVTQINDVRLRYAQVLRSWYGALSLDRVKDWILTYPTDAKQPAVIFDSGEVKSVDSVDARFQRSSLALYPLGVNLVAMNIRQRELYDVLIPAFNRFAGQLLPAVRNRATAMLLLSAYLNSGDDLAPTRICLSGCPNMSADGFCVPAEVNLLFPDHPMAGQWRDQFEKTLQLMGCFYTRPDVAKWDALGGAMDGKFECLQLGVSAADADCGVLRGVC